MDSLTQIVLGAAVGEVALGRKIGNRALVWGAIGGTIPDLDVLANSFLNDIDALAFHRGITHSIFFSVVAPFLFGWLVWKLYDSEFHKTWYYKSIVILINILLIAGLTYIFHLILNHGDSFAWWKLIIAFLPGAYLLYRLYKYYLIKKLGTIHTTFKDWYLLFFLALATHWLLDCFTAFGTQIFMPFSTYRVAFNNISVVDPLYTIPFLIFMILVSNTGRLTARRKLYRNLGLGISSFYMLLTLANKLHIDHVFDKAYAYRNLHVTRSSAGPTILNNVLWSGVAEDERNYYVGRYSIFDQDPNLHYLNTIPKNDSLEQAWSGLKDYHVLKWFANGYIAPFKTDTAIYLCDLRYGGLTDTITGPEDMIFNFKVVDDYGSTKFEENRERPGDMGEMFRQLMRRIKGY